LDFQDNSVKNDKKSIFLNGNEANALRYGREGALIGTEMEYKLDQSKAPLFEAYKAYATSGVTPFHVPGHKMGRGADPEMLDILGRTMFMFDNTSLPQTDNLQHPCGPVRQAQELAAELYGAQATFFSVNGTSGAVMAMILSALKRGEKIIIPRNVHKSVTAGIILAGATPVYVQPVIDEKLGIAHCVTPESVMESLRMHPDAKAVLITSPTYYGVASDTREISKIAHSFHVPLLVDEAHGAHLRFCPDDLPEDAVAQGADLVSQSSHKTIGSLTQSSMLHVNSSLIPVERVASVLNLLHTTSPSFLLLGSLDCARRNMALNGKRLWADTLELYREARTEINKIDGLHSFGEEDLPGKRKRCFDPTKLTICCRGLGMTGHELEATLYEEYGIQVEFSNCNHVLLVGSHGDSAEGIQRLIHALRGIASERGVRHYEAKKVEVPDIPRSAVTLGSAFFSGKRTIPFQQSEGAVSAEFVISYPPGIPILCPGEVITRQIIDYCSRLLEAGVTLTGMESCNLETIRVVSADAEPSFERNPRTNDTTATPYYDYAYQ